ncbi:WGxxGxxG family protein [Coleofasciculus sp. FACHB-1120]|uniref:WGxxGxxG family protein n=1 Tax=Coleofasciculus sp. FACHB-1120 TaxID=2692783 RepID=UPI0016885B5C|nr:WGxxGxxG family protein [Coleofasciculus sp. FACHB-1120]MBD2741672.1 WGxxGxxG-CTERM domain-containing protein [Coleofasciculus sp. FACHB-1120]
MKVSNLPKLLSAGVLAASVALVPMTLPASAQTDTTTSPDTTTNTAPDTTTTTPNQGVTTTNYEGDRDFNWGWLGLLGLAGLAGLSGRKNDERVAYRDPNEATSSTYRR